MFLCKFYTSAFGERVELCSKELGCETEEEVVLRARADTIKLSEIINAQMKSRNPRWTNIKPGDIEFNATYVQAQLDIFGGEDGGFADALIASQNRIKHTLAKLEWSEPRSLPRSARELQREAEMDARAQQVRNAARQLVVQ